jgi:hypothetical protein
MSTAARKTILPACLALAFLQGRPSPACAEERGRTDGPEGEEIGKGGYEPAGDGHLFLGLQWGAALSDDDDDRGAPLFIGGAAQYWLDDWLQLEAGADYVWRTKSTNVLVGPKFRATFEPLSLCLGLEAGAIFISGDGARFLLSPTAGADLLLGRHLLVGLYYAFDAAIGADQLTHRIFLALGIRL